MEGLEPGKRLPVLVLLLVPGVARAQVFSEPLKPPPEARGALSAPRERWLIGTYLASWQYPAKLFQAATVGREWNPGPLLTAEYSLTKDLSLGGYWNRFTGHLTQSG